MPDDLHVLSRRRFIARCAAGAAGTALLSAMTRAEPPGAAPRVPPAPTSPPLPAHLRRAGPVAEGTDVRKLALEWFRDARFGLFIHYGLYSLDGRHPYEQFDLKVPVAEYERKAARFTAEKFDAAAICDLAVAAEMRYVTLVCKHCDGFCLWDSKLTGFNSVRAAAGRDLVGEMVAACNARGLAFFAFYEYGVDWHHPHGPRRKDFSNRITEVNYPTPEPAYAHGADYDLNRYIEYAHDQVAELLTNYGPIAGIWLDGIGVPISGDATRFRCQDLYDRIHRLQPHALVSFKFGITGTEDFFAPETPQLARIKPGGPKLTELCEPLSAGWGFVNGVPHHDADWVMQRLAFTREKGMNYLLNIGPLADGSVFPADERTLRDVGGRLRAAGGSAERP